MRIKTLSVCFLLTAAALCGGCYEVVVRDSADYWRNLGSSEWQRGEEGKIASENEKANRRWSLLLKQFDGPDRNQKARQLMYRLDRELNVPDLYEQEIDDVVYVYRGRYKNPAGHRIANDMQQTRRLELDGKRPFENVKLAVVGKKYDKPTDPYDLRNFSGMLSLQIAVYKGGDKQRRQAAEKAVEVLREDGDEAYFYHGQTMSMVTVGLFTREEDVFDRQIPMPDGSIMVATTHSDRVTKLQAKYPDNLINGRRVMVPDMNGKKQPEKSCLVVVP